MISTKEERIEKARKLLTTLLGGVEEFLFYFFRKENHRSFSSVDEFSVPKLK